LKCRNPFIRSNVKTFQSHAFLHVKNMLLIIINVPDMRTGCCLGSEGNGVSVEEGSEGGPGQPERGKDKQSMPNKGRDNMGKDEEEQSSQT
jgi:hypothetical protein